MPKISRRQAVVESLAAIDLEDDAQPPGLCRPIVSLLQQVLSDLGGGFALFGRYVSSRMDLLPTSECAALARIEDLAPSLSFNWVCALFEAEMGRSIDEAYVSFDPEPFESHVLYQSHMACLHNGQEAIVRVLKPDAQKALEVDLKLFSLLEPVYLALGWSQSFFGQVQVQFERTLAEQTDFVGEASALQLFYDEAKSASNSLSAKVWPAWCSPNFLTVSSASGRSLSSILVAVAEGATNQLSIAQRQDLAMALCGGWVRQVFGGHLFPVDPYLEHLSVSPATHISIRGGQFSRLTPEMRENLWSYINAVALHDPDMACKCLLRDMLESPILEDELKHLFRQVVPFRDGGWNHLGHLDSLPEHAFLQWQIAGQHGCRPGEALVDFYRSFSLIAYAVHSLVPHKDIFGDALEGYRSQRERDRFQAAFDMGQWSDAMDKYATTFSDLPQKVDNFLSRAAEGNLNLKFRLKEANEHREARNTSALGFALALVLVSLVLIVNYLSQNIENGQWIEQVGAVVFLFVGGGLLRVLTRSKTS